MLLILQRSYNGIIFLCMQMIFILILTVATRLCSQLKPSRGFVVSLFRFSLHLLLLLCIRDVVHTMQTIFQLR